MAQFKFNKKMKLLVIEISIITSLCNMFYGTHVLAEKPRMAQIINIKGEAKVFIQGGERPVNAFKGMSLLEGDSIVVGKNSQVSFMIDNDKEIIISENNQITLTELSGQDDNNSDKTRISLWAGKIWSEIKSKLKGESKFEIKASSTVMGVRGTKFYVDFYDENINVGVLEGVVSAITSINTEDKDGNAIAKEIQTVLNKNKEMNIDTKNDKEDKNVNIKNISKEDLDLFVLEIIKENPENIDKKILEGIDEVIEKKKKEKSKTVEEHSVNNENETDNTNVNDLENNVDFNQIDENASQGNNETHEQTLDDKNENQQQINDVEEDNNADDSMDTGNGEADVIEDKNAEDNKKTEEKDITEQDAEPKVEPEKDTESDNNTEKEENKKTNEDSKNNNEKTNKDSEKNNEKIDEDNENKDNKEEEQKDDTKEDNSKNNGTEIEKVNNAKNTEEMKNALESENLGLSLSKEYMQLTVEKEKVYESMLAEKPAEGYSDKQSIQAVFDKVVEQVLKEKAEADKAEADRKAAEKAAAEEKAKLALAVDKVNNAKNTEEMKNALQSENLGLSLSKEYMQLTVEKEKVYESMLIEKPAEGYADKQSIQAVFDKAVKKVLEESMVPAQPNVELEFNEDGTVGINGIDDTMEYQVNYGDWKNADEFSTNELLNHSKSTISINVRLKAQMGENGNKSGHAKTLTINNNSFDEDSDYDVALKKKAGTIEIESLKDRENVWIKVGQNNWQKYSMINNKVSIDANGNVKIKYIDDNSINELKILSIRDIVVAPLVYDNYIEFSTDNESTDVKFKVAVAYTAEIEKDSIKTGKDLDDIMKGIINFGFGYYIDDAAEHEGKYRYSNNLSGDSTAYIVAEYKSNNYIMYVSENFDNDIIMTVEGQGTINSSDDSYEMLAALEMKSVGLNFEKDGRELTEEESLKVAEKMIEIRPEGGFIDRKSIFEAFTLAISEVVN